MVEPVWEGEDELETPWEEYRDKIKAMLQGGGHLPVCIRNSRRYSL